MGYYEEQEARQKRWPWSEISIYEHFVITKNADDNNWQLQDCTPGKAVFTYGNCWMTEEAARAHALLMSRYRYRDAHHPQRYRGRFPVLYVELDAITEWDWVIASMPVPAMGGIATGGYVVIDQSVHPSRE